MLTDRHLRNHHVRHRQGAPPINLTIVSFNFTLADTTSNTPGANVTVAEPETFWRGFNEVFAFGPDDRRRRISVGKRHPARQQSVPHANTNTAAWSHSSQKPPLLSSLSSTPRTTLGSPSPSQHQPPRYTVARPGPGAGNRATGILRPAYSRGGRMKTPRCSPQP
jgi:hypothetical protein